MVRPRTQKPPAGFIRTEPSAPFLTMMGRYYQFPQEGASPVYGIRVRRKHLNRYGTAHGGFLATMTDGCMAAFIRGHFPRLVGMRTISLQLEYKRPCTLGSWMTIHETGLEQHRTERGERCLITVEIRTDGELSMRAIGKFKLIFDPETP